MKLKIGFLCLFIVQMEDLAKVVDKVPIKGQQFLHFHFLLFILSSSSYNNKNLAVIAYLASLLRYLAS